MPKKTATKPSATAKTPKAAKPAKAKKLSALDAAAKVLAESSVPMSCPALVEAMASRKLWKSPGGKTPAATLHAAICTEIRKKGPAARFLKAGRGQFVVNAPDKAA